MTEMVTSGSMSGKEKRSDGLLGECDNERRHMLQAPPALPVTALLLDSTDRAKQATSGSNGTKPTVSTVFVINRGDRTTVLRRQIPS